MGVKKTEVIIEGQTYSLTLNSTTGKYESTITAPSKSSYSQSGHFFGITVRAEDDAGNITTKDSSDSALGSKLRLVVKEKVAPAITITSPTEGAFVINNKQPVAFKVTDNDSGVNQNSIKITIDNGAPITSGITKTAITGGVSCTYTPTAALSDGSHTIKIEATDNDGNVAVPKTVSFKIDTVPPTLSIVTPTDNLITNQSNCTVSGTTNDATSSPCTVTVKLNTASAQAATVNANGSFSKNIMLVEGTNTITIVSTDSAGKTTTVTRSVILDTVPPIISEVTITPNPVDAGKTFIVSVAVTD